jgi:hypothetical protein
LKRLREERCDHSEGCEYLRTKIYDIIAKNSKGIHRQSPSEMRIYLMLVITEKYLLEKSGAMLSCFFSLMISRICRLHAFNISKSQYSRNSRFLSGPSVFNDILLGEDFRFEYNSSLHQANTSEDISSAVTATPTFHGLQFLPGDLVEISFNSNSFPLQLAIVKKRISHSGALVVTLPDGSERLAFKHHVRFHGNNFLKWLFDAVNKGELYDVEAFRFMRSSSLFSLFTEERLLKDQSIGLILRAFEHQSRVTLSRPLPLSEKPLLEACEETVRALACNPEVLNKTFTVSSFVGLLVQGNLSLRLNIILQHAVHRYLFFNTKYLVKPPYLGPEGPYFVRSNDQMILLNRLNDIKQNVERRNAVVQVVRDALQNTLHYPKKISNIVNFSEDSGLFFEALKHYAKSHALNEHHNPFKPYAQVLLSGILDSVRTPADLYLSLLEGGLIDEFTEENIHIYQSCLHVAPHTGMDEAARQVLSEKDFASREATSDGTQDRTLFFHSYSARRDFDGLLAIAIDSADTTEVDDALSVLPDGQIVIHIADPSEYIRWGSYLDKIVSQKVATLYAPENKYPMMPDSLVERTTLREATTQKTLSFICKLDASGKLLDYQIVQGTLQNLVRMTYEQVDAVLAGDSCDPIAITLRQLLGIAEVLQKVRLNDGALMIELPRPRVKLGVDRNDIRVEREESPTKSQLLVSEAMILAGYVAGCFGKEENLALPFRYHSIPDHVRQLFINLKTDVSYLSPEFLVKAYQAGPLIPRSFYKLEPCPHNTLALSNYCRVTSPMRRYPDLLAHQLIKYKLNGRQPDISQGILSFIDSHPVQSFDLETIKSRIDHANSIEPKIKHCQNRTIKLWILKKLQRECGMPDVVYEASVVAISPDCQNIYVFVHKLCLSFMVRALKSYMLGDTIKMVPFLVHPYSNTVRWQLL